MKNCKMSGNFEVDDKWQPCLSPSVDYVCGAFEAMKVNTSGLVAPHLSTGTEVGCILHLFGPLEWLWHVKLEHGKVEDASVPYPGVHAGLPILMVRHCSIGQFVRGS